jgi:3-dehydroquinate synthase
MANHGFSVPFSFPVHFTRAAWSPENAAIVETVRRLEPTRRHRVLVVIDDHVHQAQPRLTADVWKYIDAHAESLQLVTAPIIVAGGEAAKNDLVHSLRILQHVNDEGLDRQSCIIVIGGGAVLDMVSFAAAIAHRGVRVVRMPTTVLSQADSGIAVKNSINLFGKKNFIGTFVPAFGIVNDVEMLHSLPLRDKIAGISEAVKVSLLRDAAFYNYLESNAARLRMADEALLPYVVQRSAELHLAHICGNGDPFELGSARPLDFGHWVAHKLESMTAHRLRHGEAVAIGMAVDLLYSHASGLLDRVTMERILSLLRTIGFRLWDEALLERAADGRLAVLDGLQEFRQHLGGELHVTLLRGIGTSVDATEMDDRLVVDAIEALARRDLAGAASAPLRAAARP